MSFISQNVTLVSRCLSAFAATLLLPAGARAGDWPQWRHDAYRSAISPDGLPRELHLQWSLQLPPAEPAWPWSQHKLRFDAVSQPVAAGKTVFVSSTVNDTVTAYDIDTGAENWRFYTDAPVRFAPAVFRDRVYAVSDDGYLYCLSADTGKLEWRVRGGPSDTRILGNDRLVSMWPARGGPVIRDGVVYFAAGIWPFMGVFVHAVDAGTGKVIWTNSGTGSMYLVQPHSSPAFAGVAPQGYIAATKEKLLVSGGRTVPAVFDRATGKFLYFHVGSWQFGKDAGGYEVAATEQAFLNGGALYSLSSGNGLDRMPVSVLDEDMMIGIDPGRACIMAWSSRMVTNIHTYVDGDGKRGTNVARRFAELWTFELPIAATDFRAHGVRTGSGPTEERTTRTWRAQRIHLKAGSTVYGSGTNGIFSLELPDSHRKTARLAWFADVEGSPVSMLAAGGKLLTVTDTHRLYCFGASKRTPTAIARPDGTEIERAPRRMVSIGQKALAAAGSREGYCVSLGLGSGGLVTELLRNSELRIIVVDPDADKIAAFRGKMDEAGLYGKRVSAHTGNPFDFAFPPYLANLIVCEDLDAAGFSPETCRPARIFAPLRPYGGTAYLSVERSRRSDLVKWIESTRLENCHVSTARGSVCLTRRGALPDAATWTHQYADAANTVVSADARVKAPLGLLWFGGPSNDAVLPRHGHGPSPQVVGGRLFIEGPDMLRAVDVYTGRLLWERQLSRIGAYYDNTDHQPGANQIGSNYVSLEDGVYVMAPTVCIRLDPITGKTLSTFHLPRNTDGSRPNWGSIRVWEDYLIVAASPLNPRELPKPVEEGKRTERIKLPDILDEKSGGDDQIIVEPAKVLKKESGPVPLDKTPHVFLNDRYSSSSRSLLVLNRHTGKLLWHRNAAYNFRHNAVAAGTNSIFCIDGMSPARLSAFKRRGFAPKERGHLYALEARTGYVFWQTDENVIGTFLSYSKEHDILLQSSSAARDRAWDEPGRGLVAYQGRNGRIIWQDPAIQYSGPCLLHHDMIILLHHDMMITQGFALDLFTGRRIKRVNPLTGEVMPWTFVRNYGCTTAIGSEYLLTFRSAAAGFADLVRGGTGNIGGFKSGCTANLIPADGVLSAPDYTRTCTCSYQNQSSLAMVHMPEAELWTFNALPRTRKPIKRVGINFGAPGDRLADNDTLWLDFPSVGGPSPDIQIKILSGTTNSFRDHASVVAAADAAALPWVAASGLVGSGETSIRIRPVDSSVTMTRLPEIPEDEPLPPFIKKWRTPPPPIPGSFTVRLHFAEPGNVKRGRRVFDVALQGKTVLTDFDIVSEAGGPHRAIVREFKGVMIEDLLRVDLIPRAGAPIICGIELNLE